MKRRRKGKGKDKMEKKGKVKLLKKEKGLGLIKKDDGGEEILVNIYEVKDYGMKGIDENKKV